MIYKDGNSVAIVYKGRKPLAFRYIGTRLFWQSIRSCYGRGVWMQEKPWLDGDTWKDNK